MKTQKALKHTEEEVIRANKFELVDDKGGVRAALEYHSKRDRKSPITNTLDERPGEGPSFTLYGNNGETRLSLSVNDDSWKTGDVGDANIQLFDREGKNHIWIRICYNECIPKGAGPSLTITKVNGNDVIVYRPIYENIWEGPWSDDEGLESRKSKNREHLEDPRARRTSHPRSLRTPLLTVRNHPDTLSDSYPGYQT